MQVRDLTDTECQEVLQRLNLGRIACAKDNQPYVVPAYFYLDGRYLYSFGTLGQKIEWMRTNPRVCVERAMTLFQTRRAWWSPAAAKRGTREHHVPIVYRISITRLTGRRTSSLESGS
jgi:nitroimidazol reductase NimA-like FMN-containing flavoprotein (pyridoxamine 5'-phosphate oxidase superfamily)